MAFPLGSFTIASMNVPPAGAPHYLIKPQFALAELRENTCYGGLRFAIDMVAYAAVVVGLLALLHFVANAVQDYGHAADRERFYYLTVVLPLALFGLAVALVFVAREALRVLIDIADTVIAGHARGERFEAAPVVAFQGAQNEVTPVSRLL
jgi:hypothetical protein